MTKSISTITGIDEVIDEIIPIIAQKKFNAGMELLEMRFLIGVVLLKSSLWKRETRQELIDEVATRCNLGERSLRYCAEFAEKYKTWEIVVSQSDPNHKLPAWRDIVQELPSSRKPKEEKESCKHCKIHCR